MLGIVAHTCNPNIQEAKASKVSKQIIAKQFTFCYIYGDRICTHSLDSSELLTT